ncbi:hypothetical protein Barb6_02460 [Bacteroidales bacterium Barb6]|nr:hypothetical protein Barb6_02460 [Bacteroidales bacterium Barb6]
MGEPVRSLPALLDGLQKLKEKGLDLGQFFELSDTRSVGALAVITDNVAGVKTLTAELTNCNDKFYQIAKTMDDNVKGAMAGLSSAGESVILSFEQATSATGRLKAATDSVADSLRGLSAIIAGVDMGQMDKKTQESAKTVKQVLTHAFAVVTAYLIIYARKVVIGWTAAYGQITTAAEVSNAELSRLVERRIAAEQKLARLQLKHSQATGAAQVKLAQQVEAQKTRAAQIGASAQMAATDAYAANAKAQAWSTANAFGKAQIMMTTGIARLKVAFTSLWSVAYPMLLITGLIEAGALMDKLHDEAQRIKDLANGTNVNRNSEEFNTAEYQQNRWNDTDAARQKIYARYKGREAYMEKERRGTDAYGNALIHPEDAELMKGLNKEAKDAQDQMARLRKEAYNLAKVNTEPVTVADVTKKRLEKEAEDKKKKTVKPTDKETEAAKKSAEKITDIETKTQESKLKIQSDGYEKGRGLIEADIQKRKNDAVKSLDGTKKNREAVTNLIETLEEERKTRLTKYDKEYEKTREKTNLENRLSAVEKGSKEELDLTVSLLEEQRKAEIEEAEKTGAAVLAINNKWDKKIGEAKRDNAKSALEKRQRGELLTKAGSDALLDKQSEKLEDIHSKGGIGNVKYERLKEGIEYAKKYGDAILKVKHLEEDLIGLEGQDRENKLLEIDNARTERDSLKKPKKAGSTAEQINDISTTYGNFDEAISGIDGMVSALDRLHNAFDPESNATAWEKLMAVWQAMGQAVATINGINTAITAITAGTKAMTVAEETEGVTSAAITAAKVAGAAETVTATGTVVAAKQVEEAATTAAAVAADAAKTASYGITAGAASALMAAETAAFYAPLGPFGIATATAQIATYKGMIAAAAIPFAKGGIADTSHVVGSDNLVKGNSYSGDKVLARLNSGEMILNKDQQKGLYHKFGGEGGFGRTEQSQLFSAINSGSGFAMGGIVEKMTESAKPKQKFATGGVVGGSSFTGDNLLARVNSGEVILNREQQEKIYHSMEGGRDSTNGGGGDVRFEIAGTKLVGVLANINRQQEKRR